MRAHDLSVGVGLGWEGGLWTGLRRALVAPALARLCHARVRAREVDKLARRGELHLTAVATRRWDLLFPVGNALRVSRGRDSCVVVLRKDRKDQSRKVDWICVHFPGVIWVPFPGADDMLGSSERVPYYDESIKGVKGESNI
jgi:hypothetical protein